MSETVKAMMVCDHCHGDGHQMCPDIAGPAKCTRCGGTGSLPARLTPESAEIWKMGVLVGTGRRGMLMGSIARELDHAYNKHGREPWGRHEFYGILLEEVDELWDEIKRDGPQDEVLAEARQVAAMIFRYVETSDRYRGAHPDMPQRAVTSPGEPTMVRVRCAHCTVEDHT